MNRVFADTSGLVALLVSSDEAHGEARRSFAKLEAMESVLLTTSYVLVELYALMGRRFGIEAVKRVRDHIEPLLTVGWVDDELHEAGLDLLISQKRRRLSLVDAVSMVYMRKERLEHAFAFDSHFEKEGFVLI